nr:MAG TPA: hypothetical protein [Caudoviricetes sp.]
MIGRWLQPSPWLTVLLVIVTITFLLAITPGAW